MDWLDRTEMEWSYRAEVAKLRAGDGERINADAVLAIAKALLQSGISYFGGYQGAPMAYLMDCMDCAQDLLGELGVHFAHSANEAAAAAMLGASVNYPIRGAVCWKSVAGTAVASDAIANLATSGVMGGTLMIVGADFGEGSNVGQERTHASAVKSQFWLIDPRPDVANIVRMVEKGFELSEASHTPAMLELRIRASHVTGSFTATANKPGRRIEAPSWSYSRLVLPPATFAQEKAKINERLPAARRFILDQALNEIFPGEVAEIGIIVQGGLHNAVLTGLRELNLADVFGNSRVPVLTLNVVYPLVPEQIEQFCAGKRAVLVVEEGYPGFIEAELRTLGLGATLVGKGVMPQTGECTPELVLDGLVRFLEGSVPQGVDLADVIGRQRALAPAAAPDGLAGAELARPPGFCTGCPERPVFSALKLLERETGKLHLAADIGCHLYSSMAPFNMGNTVMGYGLGLAGGQAVAPNMRQRMLSSMGDGGFWHNGLTSSVVNAVENNTNAVLVIYDNGYTSSTGAQHLPSTGRRHRITAALRGVGVRWIRRVRTYDLSRVIKTLRAAITTPQPGLKVIVAQNECQLALQRRAGPKRDDDARRGARMQRERFGVDEEVCTGDHSCIRLSGCPSLTVKPSKDVLRVDPVAHVNQNCVGCGLCGEIAHAAVLCPSFHRARIVRNPRPWERAIARFRNAIILRLAPE